MNRQQRSRSKTPAAQHCTASALRPHGARRRLRRGYLLLEAAVALALLAAAATAVAGWAGALARQRRAQMQQMAVQLAAENAVERLRMARYDDLPQLAEQLAGDGDRTTTDQPPSADAPLRLDVQLAEFTAQGIAGRHITVRAAGGRQASGRPYVAAMPLWRFDDHADAAPGRTSTAASGEPSE